MDIHLPFYALLHCLPFNLFVLLTHIFHATQRDRSGSMLVTLWVPLTVMNAGDMVITSYHAHAGTAGSISLILSYPTVVPATLSYHRLGLLKHLIITTQPPSPMQNVAFIFYE